MRHIILLSLFALACQAQPIGGGATFVKGNPPGGIGGACSPVPQVGYLDASGHAITCPISTLVWTVLAAGGGGATIPSTTNLIAGDGAGNGANSKVAVTSPATAATIQFAADNETVVLPGGTLVPNSRTVAGHALSSNVTVSATDIGLGSVTNDAQTKAAIVPNTAPSAGQILAGNAGGTAYAPVSVSGSCTMTSAGVMSCSGSGISGLTTTKLPKAASPTSIGDSSVSDDGTTVSTSEAFTAPSISTGASPPAVTFGTAGAWVGAEGTCPSAGFPSVGVGGLCFESSSHTIKGGSNNAALLPVAFVGGPLGTPASGVGTNLTGIPAAALTGSVGAANGGTGQTTYTKGDLLCATGSTTLVKLGVGSDTNVLTADSTQTCGVKWAAPSGGTNHIPLIGTSPFANTNFTTGVTSYLPVSGSVNAPGAESNEYVNAPVSGTVKNLYIVLNSAQPGGCDLVLTVRHGTFGAMSNTIVTGTVTGGMAAGAHALDTTHSFSVSAGDLLTIQGTNGACTSSFINSWSLEIQ